MRMGFGRGGWLGGVIAAVLLLALMPALPRPAAAAEAPRKVVLQLQWDHQFQFAGYYAAQWMGYYRDAGFEVEIRPAVHAGGPLRNPSREVAEGRAQFGVGNAGLLTAYAEGLPLTVVATIFQQSGTRLYFRKDTNVQRLSDLLRLKIGRVNGNPLIDVELSAMFAAEGIDPRRLDVVYYEPQETLRGLRDGRYDVIFGYSLSAPWEAPRAGVELNALNPASYGVDFYGDSLFTSTALAQGDPEMVSRFREASLKGWQYALEHPAEIADRIVRDLRRTIPVTDPAGFNRFQAAGVRELTLYPLVELGNINPGRWRRMYEALQGLGLAKVPFDAERFIFNPERIEGERQRQARLWLGGALAVVLVLAGVGLLWLRALRRAVAERTAALREQTLRLVDSEARYRAFFDNSTECLIVFDVTPEGFVFRAANPPAQAALSLEEAALQGRRPADVMAPAAAERVGAAMARCVAERTAVRTEEHLDLPGGSRTWDTILVPLFAADGRIDRVLGSARDVTDRRHLEETLRQAQKMEALGQLTGGVAHDFNNLLTVISGNLHLAARRAQDDPRLTRWLGAAAQAAKRGEALTRQLLAFSRKQELVPQPTDLNARLADMAEGMLPRSLRGDIRIELELAADPAIVSVDPNQLELAVLNLAVNARDAMPNGGALRVATRNTAQGEVAAGDFVALTVSDTGTGMPPDVLARVFEPFFTTKEVGKGTGLGLSMVYGFVKQSGGTVRVTSTPGLGTVFTLFLPRAAAAAGPAEAESRDAAPAGHGTILLVEDNRDIAELTGSLLRDAGYQVLPAGSAAEALTIIHRGVPLDLVFSDIVMPGGLSGVDLAREVRRLRPDVPVLLTSGYSTNAEAAVQEGFPLLPKPYTPPALAKAIEQAMAGRQPAPELDQA